MKYYAKKWTMGRGIRFANTGADVAEFYAYRTNELRHLAVAEGVDMEAVNASEARKHSPQLMVRVAHTDGRNTFERAEYYTDLKIGAEYENETIIG